MQRVGAFDDSPIEARAQRILDEGEVAGLPAATIARLVASFVTRHRIAGADVRLQDGVITVTLPGATLRKAVPITDRGRRGRSV